MSRPIPVLTLAALLASAVAVAEAQRVGPFTTTVLEPVADDER